jgi:hypothetical protein
MENNEQLQSPNNLGAQQPQPNEQGASVSQQPMVTPAPFQQPVQQPVITPDPNQQPMQQVPVQQNAGQQPMTATQPQVAQQPMAMPAQNNIEEIKWYRKYWWFAFIFIILPLGLFIGIYLLATGTIYRKDKDTGQYKSVSNKEKSALIILGLLLWSFSLA